MTAKIPLSDNLFLHFPTDEICTTADCTQSGKCCVFVPFLYCLHLKALIFHRGGQNGKKEIETAAGAGGFQTYLEENGLFKCEYVASKSKQ